jgi:1,3-beta-galactosyl-N-acetylhexosamine phosphorylase
VISLCEEFRGIRACAKQGPSWKAPVKVAVLNAWGPLRAWINSFGVPQKFLEKRVDVIAVAGTNLLECLAGLPVEVTWLSFEQLAKEGVPADVDVIINDGDAGTAWSGGDWWAQPEIAAALRRFVAEGGGFLGCRGPSACPRQGSFFQLHDVMGVERETGFAVQSPPAAPAEAVPHFITEGLREHLDFGPVESNVFLTGSTPQVLAAGEGHVHAAAHAFGEGRSVFFAALPYGLGNAEALYRSLLWAARKESQFRLYRCSNPLTDCAWYARARQWVIVNNSEEEQSTTVYGPDGPWEITLPAWETRFVASAES